MRALALLLMLLALAACQASGGAPGTTSGLYMGGGAGVNARGATVAW